MIYPLTRLSAAMLIAATAASAQDCRSTSDSGATRCISGVLYRCTCTRGVGATTCTWDNAAALCSALSERNVPMGEGDAKEETPASAAAPTP
ncbi:MULTISPECIES: hypothetical protein [Methylosinus]|uniref:EGF-like domain-containing protein n=1 Tax=Methylosinus sporium TaxID=428 RepID=A0A2U1SPY9_METSR|nr:MULTISPECIES: hypothetical protein [Methylosinus]PWB93663.1 hypothetical protein C5689_11720 [Methylosinus sporium]